MNQLNTLDAVESGTTPKVNEAKGRAVSVDALRGLTMLLMASAGLRIGQVYKNLEYYYPKWINSTWDFLHYHTDHVLWAGCSLWDLIQPSFMFLVGVAVPFSIASRLAKGQSKVRMFLHAAWRSLLLVGLGVFLASNSSVTTNFLFTNVLAQIGLGYLFLFCLGWTKPLWQALAALVILAGYWGAFAMYPAPKADFDYATVGVKPSFVYHPAGFGAHWDKNTNAASAFDRWFLNKLPRYKQEQGRLVENKFVGEDGGYATLNFIPSLATMIFGLLAGTLLRSSFAAWKKLLLMLGGAAVGLGLGWFLDWTGVCPSVKRIWTPSFALFSTGWVLVALAFFYLVVDVIGFKIWTYPLLVIGANSIVFYMMFQTWWSFFQKRTNTHLGWWLYDARQVDQMADKALPVGFTPLGYVNPAFVVMLQAAIMLVSMWIVAAWLYRRKAFLRI